MAEATLAKELIKKLINYYQPKDFSADKFNIYVSAIVEFEFGFIWDAVNQHIRESVYFPRVSELIETINAIILQCNTDVGQTNYARQKSALKERWHELNGATQKNTTPCLSPEAYEELASQFADLYSTWEHKCRKRAQQLRGEWHPPKSELLNTLFT